MAQDAAGATCATCPFWVAEPNRSAGHCRHNPPQGIVMMAPTGLGGQVAPQIQGFWPPVAARDWCGKHPQRGPLPVVFPRLGQAEADGEA